MEVRERKAEEDNSYMFKRFASHNPLIYDGTPDPKAFEAWIKGMEKLFDTLQCPNWFRLEQVQGIDQGYNHLCPVSL